MDNDPQKTEFPRKEADECPACRKQSMLTTIVDTKFVYGTGGNAAELSCAVPVHRCSGCGFEFTDDKAEEIRDLAVRRHLGVNTAGQIRALRESYGLSRREFGALTRIGEASLARWESGEIIQSFGYDQFLYLLVFPENLRRLRERPAGESGPSKGEVAVGAYPLRIEPDPEGGFVASISDLPGYYAAGKTKQEAIERLEESKAAWLESYQAMHDKTPEPGDPVSFSGRVLMRLPKYLHRKLHERARDEGVSVNQYLVALVAEGLLRGERAR